MLRLFMQYFNTEDLYIHTVLVKTVVNYGKPYVQGTAKCKNYGMEPYPTLEVYQILS